MDTGASEAWCIASKKKKIISPISLIKFSGEKEREQSFSEWIPARTSAQF